MIRIAVLECVVICVKSKTICRAKAVLRKAFFDGTAQMGRVGERCWLSHRTEAALVETTCGLIEMMSPQRLFHWSRLSKAG